MAETSVFFTVIDVQLRGKIGRFSVTEIPVFHRDLLLGHDTVVEILIYSGKISIPLGSALL